MSIAEELKKLSELKDLGALTEGEFQEQKARILNRSTSSSASSAGSALPPQAQPVQPIASGGIPGWAIALIIGAPLLWFLMAGVATQQVEEDFEREWDRNMEKAQEETEEMMERLHQQQMRHQREWKREFDNSNSGW